MSNVSGIISQQVLKFTGFLDAFNELDGEGRSIAEFLISEITTFLKDPMLEFAERQSALEALVELFSLVA